MPHLTSNDEGAAMKVGQNTRVNAPQRTRTAAPAGGAQSANSAPKDTLSIAGVPKAELTPRVMRALAELMEEVASLRHELAEAKARVDELSTMAFTDSLTEVFNRRAFVAELNRTLALADRHGQAAALAYFDLDDMKNINDSLGHAGGDAALTHVASKIKENVRQTDVVGRLGGDEFGVIFNYSDKEAAAGKVRYIRDLIINTPARLGEETFKVGVTAGLAPIVQGTTAEATLDLADAAMYEGKKKKKVGR
ncbi:MAG: GGDEF domain-containing protein [Pseudomonadota bacterium]